MTGDKVQLGRYGEELAAAYLTERGYSIVAKNVRTRFGELDLVARKVIGGQDSLIFAEVKTRRSTTFGHPEQAVTDLKLKHMIRSAFLYLEEHPELDLPFQLDVISIYLSGSADQPEIKHFENVSL